MKLWGWAALLLAWLATPTWAQENGAAETAVQSADEQTSITGLVEEGDDDVPPLIPAAHFAASSELREPLLSPDGQKLGVLIEIEGNAEVVIFDAATRELVDRISLSSDLYIRWFEWAGSGKILISFSTKVSRDIEGRLHDSNFPFTRLLAYDFQSKTSHVLDVGRTTWYGDQIVHVSGDGSTVLLAIGRRFGVWPDVYRFDLNARSEGEKIHEYREGVQRWFADEAGTVRLGMGWLRNRLFVHYRADADSKFREIARLRRGDDTSAWTVMSIVEGSDTGFVLGEDEDGKVGIFRFNYANGEMLETFYEHPQWGVEELWLRDGQPLAAVYTDDAEQIVWFDEALADLNQELSMALPNMQIRIVSRSLDSQRMLIWAGGESDPGAFYIYSAAQNSLDLFGEVRPWIDFRQLAQPRPYNYRSRDGLQIRAYLTLPQGRKAAGLPLIIMPHGGPFGVRDSLRYDDQVQLLANRGYAVIQPNFRGSGGYGGDFYDAGEGEVGRAMQDDLDDAMDALVEEGIADPNRVCVVGASYGGYAALWAVIRNPDRYRCAASWAGVTDWDRVLKRDRRFLSREDRREWRTRFEGDDDFDLDNVSPMEFAERLSRPVLLAHGTDDTIVPIDQFERFSDEAEDAEVPPQLLQIEDEGHSFTSEATRKQWFDALDVFLARHNPADQVDADGAPSLPSGLPRGVNFTPIDIPRTTDED